MPINHTFISLGNLSRFLSKLKSEKTFVQTITTGSANGNISVDGTDVAVKGLGSAAYSAVPTLVTGSNNGTVAFNGTDVAVKGLGSAAYTAIPTLVTGTDNGTVTFNGTDVAVKGLGSAAYTASTSYATASQGTKADTAVQPAALNAVSADVDNYSSWYKYEEDEE